MANGHLLIIDPFYSFTKEARLFFQLFIRLYFIGGLLSFRTKNREDRCGRLCEKRPWIGRWLWFQGNYQPATPYFMSTTSKHSFRAAVYVYAIFIKSETHLIWSSFSSLTIMKDMSTTSDNQNPVNKPKVFFFRFKSGRTRLNNCTSS